MANQFSGYDYFDFGCSKGSNMLFIRNIDAKLRGLGIDIDNKKIEIALASNFEAINKDILSLPSEKLVDFVTMSHFLEHLPSAQAASQMIQKACDLARDFIFIRQPWFDSDGLLLLHELKCYWSDWTGHPNRMTSLDFYLTLRKLFLRKKIYGYSIFGRSAIESSIDTCLIPINTPTDQHHYDPNAHAEKPLIPLFNFPIYREIVVIAKMQKDTDVSKFIQPLGKLTPILSCN